MVADSRKPRDSRAARRLNEPRAVLVAAERDVPVEIEHVRVAVVREEWRIVDRWWTERPVRRRYFDLVLESGRNAVVFRDEERGRWFAQRG